MKAPVAKSVLLAKILIKLKSYKFIRFRLPVIPNRYMYYTPLIYTLATIAIIYAKLTTMKQTNLKRIIAYNSIKHIRVIMLKLFAFSVKKIKGSIYLQIAHEIVSSRLFIIVTYLYEKHHTRLVRYYRKVAITIPIFSTFFFLFTLTNIKVPLSCNFINKFISLMATFETNTLVNLLASLNIIISAAYALFLYNHVYYGSMSLYIEHSSANRDLSRRKFYSLLPLAFLLLFFNIYAPFILDSLHSNTLSILTYMHSAF